MKVVALTSSFPYNANDERSVFVKRLYDAVVATDPSIELTVVAPHPYDGELNYKFRSLGRRYQAFGDAGLLRTVMAHPSSALGLCAAIAEFRRILAELNPDVVHANWSFAGAAAALSGFKSVVTLRGSDVHLFRYPGMRLASSHALNNATAITAVGAALANTASRALKRSVLVVENGTELAKAEPIATPEQFLLSIGTVSVVKGTVALIKAFAEFCKLRPSHDLVVAGRLSDERYVAKVREDITRLGVQNRVHLIGSVTPGQVTTLLHRASTFCGFSVSEGRPNAVLEAHVANVPCVLSDIPAHRELARASDILVNTSDAAASGNALAASLSCIRSQALASWKWSDCAARYVELFHRIGD